MYVGVQRFPSLLISARRRRPRACGGAPSWEREEEGSRDASWDSVFRREGGCVGGEAGSTVWEIVVVAVREVEEERWCVKNVPSGFGSGAGIEGVLPALGLEEKSVWSEEEGRGAVEEIVVAKEWLREVRVACAAECRDGTIEGPGRRWAFVRCAQVAMRRGPRVYWAWTVSKYHQLLSKGQWGNGGADCLCRPAFCPRRAGSVSFAQCLAVLVSCGRRSHRWYRRGF